MCLSRVKLLIRFGESERNNHHRHLMKKTRNLSLRYREEIAQWRLDPQQVVQVDRLAQILLDWVF